MDRFVSQFTNRLDAKGRVSIPAPFRGLLAKDGYEGLYVHPALDLPALDCGGHGLLREIDALMDRLPAYSEERDVFATALYSASEILKVDGEGRIVLTDRLRAIAGITDQISFVGHGHKFQLWEPDRFAAHYAESRDRLRDMRRAFGASSRDPGAGK
jgi:MraZ protein